MRPHQGSVEGKENLPRPTGHTLLDAEWGQKPARLNPQHGSEPAGSKTCSSCLQQRGQRKTSASGMQKGVSGCRGCAACPQAPGSSSGSPLEHRVFISRFCVLVCLNDFVSCPSVATVDFGFCMFHLALALALFSFLAPTFTPR